MLQTLSRETETTTADKAQVIKALCDLLANGDEADRCYACRTLGVLADRQAIPALTQRLRDEDIDVCVDAAAALGRLGEPSAVPALLESLQHDPDSEVKNAVIEALGLIGGNEVVAPLLKIVAGRSESIVEDTTDWDPWWDMQRSGLNALGQLAATEAVPVLSAVLDDEDGQDIECEVLNALSLIGGEGEQLLIHRLQHGTSRGRRRAARALGRAKSDTAAKALGRALQDQDSDVRAAAVEALADQGAQRYLPAILLLCRDPHPGVCSTAVEAASRLTAGQSTAPIDELTPLLSDPDPRIRTVALRSLTPVAADLNDETLDVIGAALTGHDAKVAAAACTLLGASGRAQVQPKLLAILTGPDSAPEVRREAAMALGALRGWNRDVADALTRAMADSAQPVRLAALKTLIDLEAHAPQPADGHQTAPEQRLPRPVEIVIAALRDTRVESDGPVEADAPPPTIAPSADAPETRGANSTLEAIGLDNEETAHKLRAQSDDQSSAQSSLGDASAENEELNDYLDIVRDNERIAQWLFSREASDVPDDVHRLAARVLGKAACEEAVHALSDALRDDDPGLRREAAASLGEIAQRHPDVPGLTNACVGLMDQLDASDRDLRINCARALGHLGNPDCTSALVARLADQEPAVRIQAIASLATLATNDTRAQASTSGGQDLHSDIAKQLMAMLNDREPGVRKAAAYGLAPLLRTRAGGLAREAMEQLVQAAFTGNGAQARDMARVLRTIDAKQATGKLLTLLDTLRTSGQRRLVIEMLEEIHGSAGMM